MNNTFNAYIESLTPAKQMIAREAVETYLRGESEEVEKITCSNDIYKKLRYMAQYEEEHAVILLLNQNCNIIKVKELSYGSLTCTMVDVRIIAKEAILNNATAVILAHNHPSGNLNPSRDDNNITNKVRDGLNLLAIKLIDHVIISNVGYFSYADSGRI